MNNFIVFCSYLSLDVGQGLVQIDPNYLKKNKSNSLLERAKFT